LLEVAYSLIEDFVVNIGRGDYIYLQDRYGISTAVADEIRCYLAESSRENVVEIAPPPYRLAFAEEGSRTPFVAYGGENEDFCWRVECLLWINGVESETRAYFDLFFEDGKFRVEFLYLGS
jgi:hypothetical protein